MNSVAQILPPEAITALKKGNKVEAIKYVREGNNLSLKEAKDFVEDYLEKTPPDEPRLPQTENQGKKISDMGWLVIAVVVVGIYYLIAGML